MADEKRKLDIRKSPNGEPVMAVFFIKDGNRWLTFGPPVPVDPYAITIDSPPAQRTCTLAGAIYWGDVKKFESKPMLCLKGDTFTFHLGKGTPR
jgi:hypothetical protein